MTQAIIYANSNGGVSVCIPTGELPIAQVKEKDTPAGSIIVDTADLPQGADAQFFDAWEMNNGGVRVNLTKAKAQKLAQFNAAAVAEAQKRQLNTLASIPNEVSDAAFTASLTAGRAAIDDATSTLELVAI
jgi:hypothetical protein